MISKIIEIAKRFPSHIAVVDDCLNVTYEELIGLAKAKAEQIKKIIGENNQTKIVITQRNKKLDAITDTLACWMLKYGFLNLPVNYPKDRLLSIIDLIHPVFFITDEKQYFHKNSYTYNSDLAYMIFTSGTTGVPKGVMIGQNNLQAFVNALQQVLPTDLNTRMLQYASFSFDASIWEIFATLSFGGTIILTPNEVLISDSLEAFMKKYEVSRALLTPVVAQSIINKFISSLKELIVGGDAFPPKILELWGQHFRLWNAYGPTEATICVLMHEFKTKQESIVLGKPLQGNNLLIDDIGQMIILGNQVGIGYLEKDKICYFNGRYETGDLIKQTEDNNFIFKGRIDSQIKIRGYRLSLNEVQLTIQSINGIESCCVIAVEEHATTSLYAFYQGEITEAVLTGYVSNILPHYMIPARFIKLSEWPLMPSGKINKNALRESVQTIVSVKSFCTNEKIEEDFKTIWQNVLGVHDIDLDGNFFQLGGQSFQALQVLQDYVDKFNFDIDLITFFNKPTLNEQIKEFVEQKGV
ncbi:MAG: non-ribosomal peptide synthetase [Candidatus Babeliales bacterium]